MMPFRPFFVCSVVERRFGKNEVDGECCGENVISDLLIKFYIVYTVFSAFPFIVLGVISADSVCLLCSFAVC